MEIISVWFNVKERLPDEYQRCVVRSVCEDGTVIYSVTYYFTKYNTPIWMYGNSVITHWTPDPMPE